VMRTGLLTAGSLASKCCVKGMVMPCQKSEGLSIIRSRLSFAAAVESDRGLADGGRMAVERRQQSGFHRGRRPASVLQGIGADVERLSTRLGP